MTSSDRAVRIVEVQPFFSTEHPDGAFSFGASTINGLTLAHVRVRVADRQGREADGWGAIFLSHLWAFPGAIGSSEFVDALMRDLVSAFAGRLAGSDLHGHPIEHFLAIQPELAGIARRTAAARQFEQTIPDLFNLVALSPIDAALHDAFGKLHAASVYDTLGPDWLSLDLAMVLGTDPAGRTLDSFFRIKPAASVPVAHTVGALDPLTPAEARDHAIAPLSEWIDRHGVHAFKVKLKGKDIEWDVSRLLDVFSIALAATPGPENVRLFGDLNEQGPSVAYVDELLHRLHAASPAAYAALDALEQPGSRSLPDDARFDGISSRKPIVLDEGLTSLDTIDRAVALGWNGVALKTCKTQSLMILAMAKAALAGLHISVQDLTNPGIALLQSAGLAARLPVILPFENNARQYYPHTSDPEATVHPEMFSPVDGRLPTGWLTSPGFGYDTTRIPRDIFQN